MSCQYLHFVKCEKLSERLDLLKMNTAAHNLHSSHPHKTFFIVLFKILSGYFHVVSADFRSPDKLAWWSLPAYWVDSRRMSRLWACCPSDGCFAQALPLAVLTCLSPANDNKQNPRPGINVASSTACLDEDQRGCHPACEMTGFYLSRGCCVTCVMGMLSWHPW